MTVSSINNKLFSALSAVNGRTLSTLSAINGQTILAGGGLDLYRPARLYRFKPQGAASLNYGHPLAQGIVNCFLFNEGGGLIVRDLANPSYVGTQSNMTWMVSSVGMGLTTAGGLAPHIVVPTNSDNPYLGDVSIVWYGSFRIGNVFHALFSKTAANGATNSPIEFRTANTNPPSLQVLASSATTLNSWSCSTSISLGFDHQIAVVRPAVINTAPTFYIDGVTGATPSGSGAATAATGTNANIQLGRRNDGGTQMDGTINLVLIYSRLLRAPEIQALFVNPHQILVPAKFH